MGCLNQVDIKRRSLTWYTARIIAPLLWWWGRIHKYSFTGLVKDVNTEHELRVIFDTWPKLYIQVWMYLLNFKDWMFSIVYVLLWRRGGGSYYQPCNEASRCDWFSRRTYTNSKRQNQRRTIQKLCLPIWNSLCRAVFWCQMTKFKTNHHCNLTEKLIAAAKS